MHTTKSPAPGDGDPVGSAVAKSARPRMTPHEVAFLLASAVRIPAVYMIARERLKDDLFDRSETQFLLLWRAASAALEDNRGVLPADPAAAQQIVAVRAAAELARDPNRMTYTPAVESAVMDEDGLLAHVFALPVAKETETQAVALLARFVMERLVGDPLRRAFAGLSGNDALADPAGLVEAIERHTRDVAGLSVDPGRAAVVDDDDFCPAGTPVASTAVDFVDTLTGGGAAPREVYTLMAPTSGGKCLAKGTPVLMYDGSVKPVEEVEVGDQLMGPDSTPRRVLSLARGREMMYRVKGVDGSSYVVNESHILSVKLSPESPGEARRVVNLSVKEYLTASKTFRHRAKGWRTDVDWPTKPVPVDPYILGLWLADGSKNEPVICKPDPEVFEAVTAEASARGLGITNRSGRNKSCPTWHIHAGRTGLAGSNSLLNDLRELGVTGGNKHIPFSYLTNDRATRLAILAGLLDGDGSYKAAQRAYEFSSTSQRLAADIAFLARSLGFRATAEDRVTTCQTGATCESVRLYIGGDCSIIPCRIARKKAEKRQALRDHTTYGITVEPVGVGDYYGFEIDGDRLFLLGDFTVTHNTACAVQLAVEGALLQSAIAAELGEDQAGHWYYFTYELNEDQLRERVYVYGARVAFDTFTDELNKDPVSRRPVFSSAADPDSLKPYETEPYVNSPGNPVRGERERIAELRQKLSGKNARLHLVDYSGTHAGHGTGGVDEIVRYLRRDEARGRRPAGVVVDYAGLAVSRYVAAKNWRPDSEYNLLAGFVDQVRSRVCVPMGCHAWVLHQLHGDSTRRAPGVKIHHSEARGCRNFADNSDFAIQLTPYNKATGLLTAWCTKHRRAAGVEEGVVVKFTGRYGVFRRPGQQYVVDPMTKQIVPKDFLDVLPAAPDRRGGPPVDPRGAL